MVLATLLITVLLALAAVAEPIVVKRSPATLPLTRRININAGTQSLVQHDQARAKALKANGEAKSVGIPPQSNSPATNEAVQYIASIGVGSPATQYDVIVDTGSSNLWVGFGKSYTITNTSEETGQSVSVTYGSGSCSGTEYIDKVTITSELVIPHQGIGSIASCSGFNGADGILGIGPVDLTIGTLFPDTTAEVATVTENLYDDGTIPAYLVSISFEPITGTSGEEENGILTWGGTDSSLYTGSITYTPITATSPSNQYFGINQSILYGSTTILSETAGIVDTGTTLILLATQAYNSYQSATGAVLDDDTGLLRVTTTQYDDLKNLVFDINGVSFTFTPNAQIWPRSLNTYIGGVSGDIYLIVNDLGSDEGSGLDFINGLTWFERFYVVLDSGNSRVGVATTPYTDATTN